jgi:hypothetical protein
MEGTYPFVLIARAQHPELDVEALTSGIVSASVIRVGVAKAVVARGHEAAHGFRVAKPEEVRSDPCLVLLRGVSVGVGRGCGDEVEGKTLVGGVALPNPKGYGDDVVAGLRSAGVDSSGGGGAEPDGGVSLRATGVFPSPRLKLDRSPARDSVPTAGYGILAERGALP